MTETDLPSRPLPGRRRPRWLYVGLVAVVVAAVSGLWLWRHPAQSFPGGYGIGGQRQVGEAVWTTLVHSGRPGAEEVTITGLEPRIRTDGTRADIEYVICELDPEVLADDRVAGLGPARADGSSTGMLGACDSPSTS